MKKFWITSSIVAIVAVGGWFYRDHIPFLDKLPIPGIQAQKQASGGADGKAAEADSNAGRKRSGGPAAVKTVSAIVTALPMDTPATGWAEADDTTTIAALEAGLITSIDAKDGQEIKAGDLIARMDARMAQATVDKDKATIVSALATLEEADAALQRAASLVKQNAQSQQTYEQAKATRDSAAAAVDAGKATLAADQVTLEHTEIRAPYDGRLGNIALSPGAYVSAGSTVVTITRYNPIYVKFPLAERYLPQLHKAFVSKAVAVDVDPGATGGVPDRGVLSSYDNSVDTGTGTVQAKARFTNDKGTLWPGQSVNVTIRFQSDEKNVVVPTVAVRPGADGFFVYRIDENKKVHAAKVVVLRANGTMTALASGLKEGDHVVIEGQSQLADGQTANEQFIGAADAQSQKIAANTSQEVTQ